MNLDYYFSVIKELKDKYLDFNDKYISKPKEAKEVDLNLYPYNEGFFVTIKYDDNELRDRVHDGLLLKHIYCVKINHGIRVGLCSTPIVKVEGLAKRIKEVENEVK